MGPSGTDGPSVGTESSQIASAAGAEAVAEGGVVLVAVEAPLDRVAASAAATSASLLPVAADATPHRCDLAFLAALPETERRILLAKGWKTKMDMAGLRRETLDKMFGLPSPALLAMWAAARRLLVARLHDSDEDVPVQGLFALRGRGAGPLRLQPPASMRGRGRARGSGAWRTPRTSLSQEEKDKASRAKAADLLI